MQSRDVNYDLCKDLSHSRGWLSLDLTHMLSKLYLFTSDKIKFASFSRDYKLRELIPVTHDYFVKVYFKFRAKLL